MLATSIATILTQEDIDAMKRGSSVSTAVSTARETINPETRQLDPMAKAKYYATRSNRYVEVSSFQRTEEGGLKTVRRKVLSDEYLAWLDSQKPKAKPVDSPIVNPGIVPTRVSPVLSTSDGTAKAVSETYLINTGKVESYPLIDSPATIQSTTLQKILNAPKGQRGKFAEQRPDESFAEYQDRLRTARDAAAKRKRDKRAALRQEVEVKAYASMLEHGRSQVEAVLSAIPPSEIKTDKGVQYKNAVTVQTSDGSSEVRTVKMTRLAQDVFETLTQHFKGFSARQNKRSNLLETQFSRVLRNVAAYRNMKPLEVSKANIFGLVQPFTRRTLQVLGNRDKGWCEGLKVVSSTLDTRLSHTPDFVPSGLEVFTQTERLSTPEQKLPRSVTGKMPVIHQEVHWLTVTARLHGDGQKTSDPYKKDVLGVPVLSKPGIKQEVSIDYPIAAFDANGVSVSVALGRADGVYSVWPRPRVFLAPAASV